MAALFGRVGWRQWGTSAPALSTTNGTSRSGRYFQDFHPLVTLSNIKSAQEIVGIDDNTFNTLLDNMQRTAIMRLLMGVVNEPEIIEEKLTFNRYFRMDVPTANGGKFVGYRLEPASSFGYSSSLDAVSLYFDSAVTFPLYLFHEAKEGYLWKLNVTAQAKTQTVVPLPETVIGYLNDVTMGGGFYLGSSKTTSAAQWVTAEIIEKYNPGTAWGGG
jgi:hypothetical protein